MSHMNKLRRETIKKLIIGLTIVLFSGSTVVLLKIADDLRQERDEARDAVHWCDGSLDERSRLIMELSECRHSIDCSSEVRRQCCNDAYQRMVSLGQKIAAGDLCPGNTRSVP